MTASSKITNNQTAASRAIVRTGAELAIRANAADVAAHDVDKNFGATSLEFSAMFADLSVDDFRTARAAWVAGYVDAMGCDAKSAANRFSEMVKACAVVKPQTPEAAKLAAKRATDKAAKAAPVKASTATAIDGAGEVAGLAAGKSVTMVVSSTEAHILQMLRAGKFALAAQCVAHMADDQALV